MMSDDDYCFFDDYDYYSNGDDDDDDFYDEDLDDHCIYMSGCYDDDDIEEDYILSGRLSRKMDPELSDRKAIYKELSVQDPKELLKNPVSLIDICSLKVALNFPFAYIEDRTPPIPENIQLKIIKNSFPQSMEKIKRYCVLNNGSSLEFDRAIRLVKSVRDLMQIGFHLSGNIESDYRRMWHGSPPSKKSPNLYVTIKFDRGKITETHCPCEMSSSWCSHVIAVCLARIFQHDKCVYKPPLSDSLNNLKSYAQLRTFTQYLIAEFSDGRIIETAQNVLDRMLTPRTEQNDAINQIWGAPDPTAGAGIDERADWLICEEGLKSHCTDLIHKSDITEGCWGLNVAELGASSSVLEWWKCFQLDKPVVEDYFCEFSEPPGNGNSAFSYNYFRQSYSREKGQQIAKFLKTCEELLKDDYSYSLKAVQTFTLRLMDVIEERNQRDYYRYDRKVFESNSHLGCVPRPQQCWLFRDQLARLWRLLVLSPAITEKQRDEIFATLEVLDTKLSLATDSTKKEHLQWESQKHIQKLKNFSWDSLQLGDGPFRNNNLAEVTIEQCVVVEPQKNVTMDNTDDLGDRFSYPILFTCGSFSSSVTVYCYMIEALTVYGETEQAVHLAMALGLSIVRYYNAWLEGGLRVPVKETLCVDWDEGENNKDAAPANTGKRGKGRRRFKRKRSAKGTKKNENEKAENKTSKEVLFSEDTGIIPVSIMAFLLHILEENVELVAEMLKLVKVQNRGTGDEDMADDDDVTSDAGSLIFRLGVVGLAMPKVQAPSLQLQVEWFNWEAYIADKMMKSATTDVDIVFLRKMTSRLINLCDNGCGFLPPYTLVTTLFAHTYKPPQTGEVSEACDDGLAVALETIEISPDGSFRTSIQKRMFFESCRRHWVKLVETVLYAVANRGDHLKKVLHSLFTSVTMIGSASEDLSVTSPAAGSKKGSFHDQKVTLIQHMIPEKVVAILYLSHSLVQRADKIHLNELVSKLSKPAGVVQSPLKSERKNFETLVVRGRKMLVKEMPVCDERKLLYETAVKVGTHAYAVKNYAFQKLQLDSYSVEYNLPEFLQRNLRWLCRISSKIDTKAFDLILERQHNSTGPIKCFNDDEVLRLCTQMLDSDLKREGRVWIMVKDTILTLLKDDCHKKINEILQLCRNVEKELPTNRALLFPPICKQLLTYLPSLPTTIVAQSSKLDYLARSMKLMHTLYIDLETDENQDNLGGLKELFADSCVSPSDKPGTSTENPANESLDVNLQLSFDLALETVKHIDENDRVRGYESRRRFENLCQLVAVVAKKAYRTSTQTSAAAQEHVNNVPPFEEVYVSRFVEVLCNTVKDCLLLTDFFFEISARLLGIPLHSAFGRDRVLLSDDCRISLLCESCTSLSVLLKRCITGLKEATRGKTMEDYIKETTQETKHYLKSRAKHSKFYYGSSLVSVLEVLKRLMGLAEDAEHDEDFESFSYKLASKHPITKIAFEELESKGPNSSPRDYDDGMIPEELISSLLLRRMFSPALACFDYDSDGWRY